MTKLDKEIKKFQLAWFAVAAILITALVAGSLSLSQSRLTNGESFREAIQYLKYRVALARNGTLFASATGSRAAAKISYSGPAADIPVLLYHGILEKPDGSSDNITVSEFAEQMKSLHNAGYTTISLKQFSEFMKGETELPDKSFLLTFDDGRRDSFMNADPIMRTYGYSAVIFAISNASQAKSTRYYLSSEELGALEATGRWDVEVHAKAGHGSIQTDAFGNQGNFYINKMWLKELSRNETPEEYAKRIERDMYEAKRDIAGMTGSEPVAFAFPFGDFGQNESNFAYGYSDLLKSASGLFDILFYQNAPGVRYKSNYFASWRDPSSIHMARRISAHSGMSGEDMLMSVERSRSKTLPFEGAMTYSDGWTPVWGKAEIKHSRLVIEPATGTEGGAAILDGSRSWKDYSVSLSGSVEKENGVFVWIRFMDDANNAACNAGKDFLHIEQIVDGKRKVIAGIRKDEIAATGNFEMNVSVKDRSVTCSFGDAHVSTDYLDQKLSYGGIGFKAWNEKPDSSRLMIDKVAVKEQ